jgi:hypothetical protein
MWKKEGSLSILLQRNGKKNGSKSFVKSIPRQKCHVKENRIHRTVEKFLTSPNYAPRFFFQHPMNPKPDSIASEHMRLAARTT